MSQQPRFLAFDFYCGAGGTTRGLLDAGGYVVAGIDKDDRCRTTYQRNNRNGYLDEEEPQFLPLDMFPVSADYKQGQQHLALAALAELIPRYRLMAAGVPLLFAICAPCQAFTKFVQRRLTDRREEARIRDRNLLAQAIPFVETFRPELVLSENVASIHRPRYGSIWSDFQSSLRELGYAVSEGRVCASRFGVPQHRRRSVVLAYRDEGFESTLSRPIPHHDPDAPFLTVEDAIGHLPALGAGEASGDVPNHACRDLTAVNRLRLMSLRPGEPNFGFDRTPYGDLSLPCHRRLPKSKRGFGDVYTRIHPSRPSPTITTRFLSISNGRFGHYDDTQVRGLSLREGAALQSFPDDYTFYADGMHAIAKMIGNAVPPRLSAFMTSWLLGTWRDVGVARGRQP